MYIKSLEDNKTLDEFPSFIIEDLDDIGLFINSQAVEAVNRAGRRMLDKIYDTDADAAATHGSGRSAKRKA